MRCKFSDGCSIFGGPCPSCDPETEEDTEYLKMLECDCGAETTGKWANQHTKGCASLKETAKMDHATLNVVQRVLAAYGSQRDSINDSDLDDEQPLSLQVRLTLGDIRRIRMMVRLQGKNPADFRVRP